MPYRTPLTVEVRDTQRKENETLDHAFNTVLENIDAQNVTFELYTRLFQRTIIFVYTESVQSLRSLLGYTLLQISQL